MDLPDLGDAPALRVRLDLAYDGTAFSGWAAQPGRRTVEGELSRALTTLVRSPRSVRLVVAGRTDAGVHARGQVAHTDLSVGAWAALPGRTGRSSGVSAVTRLAGLLPPDIAVRRVEVAPDGFDARFSAVWRRYQYRLVDDLARWNPLRRHDTVLVKQHLDIAAMNDACRVLLGLNDFAAFCKRREGATTIRTLLEFTWSRDPEGAVVATVRADAFCHSMVRALVGSVVPVGTGREGAGFPVEVLHRGLRDARVKVMPPHGLTLLEVSYPPDTDLAVRARLSRTRRLERPGVTAEPN